MEIQTSASLPAIAHTRCLVLYLHLQTTEDAYLDALTCDEFLVEVFDEAPVGTPKRLSAGYVPAADPLLSCYGEGYQEWQVALSCFDMVASALDLPRAQTTLGRWLLSCQKNGPGSYRLRGELCDQGTSSYFILTRAWLDAHGHYHSLPEVVHEQALQLPD